MKDRFLIYCSLAISVAALAYAAWIHQHSRQMARDALREREKEIVQAIAPSVREMNSGMGMTNIIPQNVTTLDELFKPFFGMISNLSSDNEVAQTNVIATNQIVSTNQMK